jgi:hypothetical protein
VRRKRRGARRAPPKRTSTPKAKSAGRRPTRRRDDPKAVTTAELRKLQRELERRTTTTKSPMRWNPDPDDVQRSVAQLVLTIVEFLRRLMERQAIRRMEQKTLTPKEVEAVGLALMQLEQTVRDIGKRFGLSPEDLNLDLGPIGKLM